MPRPRVYVPVSDGYRMPGPVYRRGAPEAGCLRVECDDERDEYLRVAGSVRGLWDCASSRARLEGPFAKWLRVVVDEDQPELLGAADTLDQMIARMQEDVVVMHRSAASPAARARVVYVNVNFPSGWCPACAPGKTFLSMHAPVPNNDNFDGAGRRAAADLLFDGEDKVRFVWSLAPDDALDRRSCPRGHGREAGASSWLSASAGYLRVERQVIAPIDPQTSCFFIRIYRYRLSTLAADVRRRIRSSLLGMPEAVRAYKGLAADFERILRLVE